MRWFYDWHVTIFKFFWGRISNRSYRCSFCNFIFSRPLSQMHEKGAEFLGNLSVLFFPCPIIRGRRIFPSWISTKIPWFFRQYFRYQTVVEIRRKCCVLLDSSSHICYTVFGKQLEHPNFSKKLKNFAEIHHNS